MLLPATSSNAEAILAAADQLRLKRLTAMLAAKLTAKAPKASIRKARKPRKLAGSKTVRRSLRIPKSEYRQLVALRKRLAREGVGTDKGQIVRAGVMLLAHLDLSELTAAIRAITAPTAAFDNGK
ncbi:MAG: hypothetical protein KDI53_10455 [Candidatus Accumulibacter sp.]|uniref:hypothetical protein n=1 Tax=Accumulibacter sp. TaxID=2053492 RepID=UPI001D82BF54|nr:hypothetical protein [Accumulibacter sp.]MCB1942441.1 hypothetical protein [Accumulibacter sp.]